MNVTWWTEWWQPALAAVLALGALRVANQQYRLSRRRRHDEKLAAFERKLTNRVRYAQSTEGRVLTAAVARSFPVSPGEPPDVRRQRLRDEWKQRDISRAERKQLQDVESLLFTRQPDTTWTLETLWSTQSSALEGVKRSAETLGIPDAVDETVSGSPFDPIGTFARDYVIVTRLAPPVPRRTRWRDEIEFTWFSVRWKLRGVAPRLARRLGSRSLGSVSVRVRCPNGGAERTEGATTRAVRSKTRASGSGRRTAHLANRRVGKRAEGQRRRPSRRAVSV